MKLIRNYFILIFGLSILIIASCRLNKTDKSEKPRKSSEYIDKSHEENSVNFPNESSKLISTENFYSNVENILKSSLSECSKNQANADSIAIYYLDILNDLSDYFYDLYNSVDSLSNDPGLENRLNDYGIVSAKMNNGIVFKGSPRIIFDKFQKYLSESGKAFFQIRMKDQLQPCFYDDQIILLPWDTLGERLQMWDRFCTEHANTYAAKQAEKYLRRYLGFYLPCYNIYNKEYYIDTVTKISHDRYVAIYEKSRTGKIISDFYKIFKPHEFVNTDSFMNANAIPVSIIFQDLEIYRSEILEPTDYQQSEANIRSKNGNWLALVRTSLDQWNLLAVKPSFKNCLNIGSDELLGETTGVCIKSPVENTKYLLLDNNLHSGKVIPSFSGEKPSLPGPDSAVGYGLNKKRYQIISKPLNSVQQAFLSYNGNSKYLLIPNTLTNASLLWVGDLDMDGRLDVILDASNDSNVNDVKLYLSSKTRSGELVRCVARTYSSGG